MLPSAIGKRQVMLLQAMRLLACVVIVLLAPPVAATAAGPLMAIAEAAEDHPVQALSTARRQLAAARARGDLDTAFWLHIGLAHVHVLMEDTAAGAAQLDLATEALARLPAASLQHRLWLDLERIAADATLQEPARLAERLATLRPQVMALGDAPLTCSFHALDLWVRQDAVDLDEAWLAAEAMERCALATRQPALVAEALSAMATLAVTLRPVDGVDAAVTRLQRALQVLSPVQMRFRRSLVEWDLGQVLTRAHQPLQAKVHFERALAGSRAIDDGAGVAVASLGIAEVLLALQRPGEALPLISEARRLLAGSDRGFRLIGAAELQLKALAALGHPALQAEIAQARQWDRAPMSPAQRAALVRAMAAGHAALGQHGAAYAELLRAARLEDEGRTRANSTRLLRLQARYESARRDAENAELRHRSESAQLQLDAQAARQRALWAAVLMLGVAVAALAYFGARALSRRRTLADLALRDELTGQPNRRSVSAYGHAQFQQARDLGVPMSLAMIDLDHFKRVNDTHGHAVGDAALRAFGNAAASVLRGQDRLGRWGGEEWLLVMPGTSADELPRVFDRLRRRFAATPIEGLPAPHGLTFSMGAAEAQSTMPSLDSLIAAADRELYRAKRDGRNALRRAA